VPPLLNCPVFAAENSTVPVMGQLPVQPRPLANFPFEPIPMLLVLPELLNSNCWPPYLSERTAKLAASPGAKPACACGIDSAIGRAAFPH
jgi:hypothetical protein